MIMIRMVKKPFVARDFNTKNLPTNPAKRGIPKRESIAIMMMVLRNGEFSLRRTFIYH